ncbi:MAG: PH domain-containing protein [Anaerolineaceae bacterium]|nr:PH domain-containing protein [Anaerolineaceae bacterium]
MELPAHFIPPRRNGVIFHSITLFILSLCGGLSLWYALQQEARSDIITFILVSLLLLVPVPIILYRGYGLLQARYTLERDGLRLRWGLRAEDIPLPDIEWIRPADDMGYRLQMPLIRWPGAISGIRNVEGLGPVEFLASDAQSMLLVATPEKVYAISPADINAFQRTFQRTIEMGSLSPLTSYSSRPVAFLQQIWLDRAARSLVLIGFLLTIILLAADGLLIANRTTLSLGYNIEGEPLPPGPAEYVLLLPILAAFIYVGDLFMGMYFYGRINLRPVAYVLWGGAVITPILLLVATYFLI